MGCSQGAHSQLLIDAATPFDGSSERYDFLYEDVIKRGRIVGARAISGTRSAFTGNTREGHYVVGGRLATYTSPADLDKWLPRALGAAEAADEFDMAESLPVFVMLIDRVGAVFQYDGLYVDKAIWRGAAGPGNAEPELIEQVITMIGQTETLGTAWPGTAPALSVGANRAPYIMADGVLTVDSVTYQIKSFVLYVDNHIQPRWVNSLYPTALCPGDRTVMLRVVVPFTSADDAVYSGLYTHASQLTGVSADLTFSNGTISTAFAFEGLQWAKTSPSVRGKTEIELTLDFYVRRTGSDSELVVTNDSVV